MKENDIIQNENKTTSEYNEENMPEWIKQKIEEGGYVYFKDGKWFASMV